MKIKLGVYYLTIHVNVDKFPVSVDDLERHVQLNRPDATRDADGKYGVIMLIWAYRDIKGGSLLEARDYVYYLLGRPIPPRYS